MIPQNGLLPSWAMCLSDRARQPTAPDNLFFQDIPLVEHLKFILLYSMGDTLHRDKS